MSGWGETAVSALVPGARVLTMAGFGSDGAQPIIRTLKALGLGTGHGVRLAFADGFALRLEREQSVWAILPADDEPEDLRRLAVIR